jgi:hypothetical protein
VQPAPIRDRERPDSGLDVIARSRCLLVVGRQACAPSNAYAAGREVGGHCQKHFFRMSVEAFRLRIGH